MSWTKALAQHELPEGTRRVVTINNQPILLFCLQNQIHAVSNRCPHLHMSLQKAKICAEDNTLVCPWHRSAFDFTSGDVKAWSPWPPVVGKLLGCLSREKALPVFPTKVEDGAIWVQM